jgi:hypothetical protein
VAEPLPVLPPSCSLDREGLERQLERYRAVGAAATIVHRRPDRITMTVGSATPDTTIEQLVAIERECCPFYELDYDPAERKFSIGVSRSEYEPALAAIAHALGLSDPPGGTR